MAKKTAAKKATKKAVAKKATKKTATKKAVAKKATTKKVAAKTTKKAATKKAVAKKATTKKTATKKTTKKAASKTKRKPNAAFMAPLTPSADLAAVVGSKGISRPEVMKKVWAYIKKNGLQDDKNKRNINADDNLKKVFDGKKQVSMFEMTKLISKHLK